MVPATSEGEFGNEKVFGGSEIGFFGGRYAVWPAAAAGGDTGAERGGR